MNIFRKFVVLPIILLLCTSIRADASTMTKSDNRLMPISIESLMEPIPIIEEPVEAINELTINSLEIPCENVLVEDQTEDECLLSEDEINLIILVMLAEAEGEPEEGQRLVIDTILNRVDSSHFPETVEKVIYQKNQFSSIWNGRINRVSLDTGYRDMVIEESTNRSNCEVVFFTAGNYGKYGEKMFSVGNHYFSKYKEK